MQTFTGTRNADTFTASTAEDWMIIGLGGGDTLTGNAGNDTFVGGFGNDILNGAGGDDLFNVGLTEGFDNIVGGEGYDRIVATLNNVAIGLSFISGIEEISAGGFAPVSIVGTTGADILDFTSVLLVGITSINGGNGADTITGSAGDDTINGGAGNDILAGGIGNDIFRVGAAGGFDSFDGGAGSNSIVAIGNNVTIGVTSLVNIQEISGDGFTNTRVLTANGAGLVFDFSAVSLSEIAELRAGSGGQTVIATAGDDFLTGGSGNDTLFGGEGSDTIDGGGGANILDGGEGDDIFLVNGGLTNTYRGGNGYDSISGGKDNAVILLTTGSVFRVEEINSGGFGNVTIAGTAGDDNINLSGVAIFDGEIVAINLGDGNDIFKATKFGDTINGGNGNDRIQSSSGDDIIKGGQGDDTIDGGVGSDTINGNNGDDIIIGGQGVDFLFGDAGNDTFVVIGASGLDEIDGGIGIDTIAAGSNGARIQIGTMTDIEIISGAGFANVTISGTVDSDFLDFSAVQLIGIRSINTGASGDEVIGSNGADTIIGLGGDDTLNGGGGADIITGGTGLDFLTGGSGDDIFRDGTKNFTGDTITDFAIGDRLQFVNIASPAAMTFAFANNTLTIDGDGTGPLKAFSFTLIGDFDAAGFVATSDGAGGSFVSYTIG